MSRKLLLIHGWSDCSLSFVKLKDALSDIYLAENILFVDYESREDNMTYGDVVDGLRDKLLSQNLLNTDGTAVRSVEFDVVVHSTGGLVIREFITRFYPPEKLSSCPIKRIVMLAPANFGSPLAISGKSALGSFLAGRKEVTNFLETGRLILNGLELGSSYQWDLAERDVLHQEQYYSAETIQVTVLVGNGQYDGLRQVVNKPGTDGTVVIAGCNLNSARASFNFSTGDYKWDASQTISDTAFGVFTGLNHSTIVEAAAEPGSRVYQSIRKALGPTTRDVGKFNELKAELAALTESAYPLDPNGYPVNKPQYQQFYIRVVDDFGSPIDDYRLEFFVTAEDTFQRDKKRFKLMNIFSLGDSISDCSDEISAEITREFYTYSQAPSYRRFLVNNDEVRRRLKKLSKETGKEVLLSIKLHVPAVDRGIFYDTTMLQNIPIYKLSDGDSDSLSVFFPHTTTFFEFEVNRSNSYVTLNLEAVSQADRDKQHIKMLATSVSKTIAETLFL